MKKNYIVWFIVIAAMLAFTAVGIDFYRTIYISPITDKTFDFEFTKGQSFTQLNNQLTVAGFIKNRHYWLIYAILKGADRHVKAGMYRIEPRTTLNKLLNNLISGNTFRYRLTLYEGWTLRDIIQAMREHPQLVIKSDSAEEIRDYLSITQVSPEGWIYPETYLFEKNTSNLSILEQGHSLMKEKLKTLWEDKDSNLPFESPYDALILASIVEKETAVDDEYARIAGVFISRLKKGMLLQADPTVIYGLGEAFDGNLRKKDLTTDTPYNSYTRKGLPPTPIAMPSEKSIAAVLKPKITGDLYFVAKGDGSHHFSKTYKAHQIAVRRYQLQK